VREGGKNGGSGLSATTEYRFDLDKLRGLPPSKVPNTGGANSAPQSSAGVQPASDGAANAAESGCTGCTQTVIEPSETRQSARSRAGRGPFQTDLGQEDEEVDMALTPSPEAMARGLKHAPGWDRAHLLREFREMNEDVEVENVDKAWVGFCRYTGANPDKPKFKTSGPLVAVEPPPAGKVSITRMGSEWPLWLTHLDKHHPPSADIMRLGKTFMAYVPQRFPASPADRPDFPRPKA
jgi:hypothetical protein